MQDKWAAHVPVFFAYFSGIFEKRKVRASSKINFQYIYKSFIKIGPLRTEVWSATNKRTGGILLVKIDIDIDIHRGTGVRVNNNEKFEFSQVALRARRGLY